MIKPNTVFILFLLILTYTACSPSFVVPKINYLQMDSLIVHDLKPKVYSTICGSGIVIQSGNIDIISIELINTENLTSQAKVIGGKDAIISLLEFPELAKRARIEGDVVADFDVDIFGSVEIKIMKSLGGGIEEAVIDALNKTKFSPAKRNKENVSCRIRIQFSPPEGVEDLIDRKEPVKLKSRKL
jgi:TonB family protein